MYFTVCTRHLEY
jgi:hypothetical protein